MSKPLDAYVRETARNIEMLRTRLRREAKRTIPSIPRENSRFDGYVYVEDVGTVVEFVGGQEQHMYTPAGVEMRDNQLRDAQESRAAFFDEIAGQFAAPARVLNVGAGADVTPIEAFERAGHEIISLDMAQTTIDVLVSRTRSPAFAADLLHLREVLPEPVDHVIGNSVLGYAAPHKLRTIVENLATIMRSGATLTFDQSPHPVYYRAVGQEYEPLINESAPHPDRLADLIRRYGIEDGINAMAHDAYHRQLAVGLAVIDLVRVEFERNGARCATGITQHRAASGGLMVCPILHVESGDSDGDRHVWPLANETMYEDPEVALRAVGAEAPWFPLCYVDRKHGEILARLLGIHTTTREAPWAVAQHVQDNQDSRRLPESIRAEVLSALSVSRLGPLIRPLIDGQRLPPRRVDRARHAEQALRAAVLTGRLQMSNVEAEARIDAEYAKEAARLEAKRGK
jgi:hypothetical protein